MKGLYVLLEGNDKYQLEEQGLRINRLDSADNGTYECRAEVPSHGNVKVRTVHLDVLCMILQLSYVMSQKEQKYVETVSFIDNRQVIYRQTAKYEVSPFSIHPQFLNWINFSFYVGIR